MKLVFFPLCLFLVTCSACAGCSTSQLDQSREILQSPLAQLQKKIAQQYADFSLNLWMPYEPRQSLPRDVASLEKREGMRKTISATGVAVLIPLALFFVSLGAAGAFDKTLSPEERKKSIKWIVIGALVMALASYWTELVTRAVVVIIQPQVLTDNTRISLQFRKDRRLFSSCPYCSHAPLFICEHL